MKKKSLIKKKIGHDELYICTNIWFAKDYIAKKDYLKKRAKNTIYIILLFLKYIIINMFYFCTKKSISSEKH